MHIRDEVRDSLPIASSGSVPALMMLLGAVGIVPPLWAQLIAALIIVGRLAFLGILVEKMTARKSTFGTLWSGVVLAGLSLIIVGAKILVTHSLGLFPHEHPLSPAGLGSVEETTNSAVRNPRGSPARARMFRAAPLFRPAVTVRRSWGFCSQLTVMPAVLTFLVVASHSCQMSSLSPARGRLVIDACFGL